MPTKSDPKAGGPQKHRLTLAQLASYDDVLTDALVDQAYFWSRIRKNREHKYLPVRGIKEDEVPQILLHKVIISKDVEDAEKSLLNLAGLRRYMGGLRIEAEKKDFRNHLRKYINMYLPDSPFEVSTTNRYTITAHEAAVTARKRIREGDQIKYLCGTLVPLTEAELKDLDLTQRNFSIVQSDRKKNTLIFLGPARFANHDCAANGRLVSVGKDGLEVHATRNIDIGEEITVTYSPGYFGANNEECLCHTCELQARNGWTSADAFGAPHSGGSTPIPGQTLFESPYLFQKGRKHGADIYSTPSRQSPFPPEKQKSDRPSSRLNQDRPPQPSSRSLHTGPTPSVDNEHESEHDNPSAIGNSSQRHACGVKRCRSPTETEGIASLSTIDEQAIADPPRKKRMRLIDQMTSSAGSSPGALTKTRLYSSTSDESGNDSSSSKTSSGSTDATSASEAPVSVKIENSEVSKIERDEGLCQASNAPSTTTDLTDSLEPLSALSTFKPTHTTLQQIKDSLCPSPSNSTTFILPSIETPVLTAHLPHETPSKATTTTTATVTTLTVLPDPTNSIIRTPGDYILTRRLVAQPFDRWVQCQTCADQFLQSNGYQTRRECPRCERHSMLYGFGWPKTEPDARKLREIREAREKEEKVKLKMRSKGKRRGTGDTIVVESVAPRTKEEEAPTPPPPSSTGKGKGGGVWGRGGKGGGRSGRSGKGTWVEGGGEEEREERVLDHRTVNRFIAPEEEREVKRRGRKSQVDLVDGIVAAAVATAAAGAGAGAGVGGNSATPDRVLARIRGSAFGGDRGGSEMGNGSASAREESVGSAGLEEGNGGALRRSKRYFGSRMMSMTL